MSSVDPTPAPSIGNVAPAQDQEVVFYEGSPKLRGELGKLFVSAILAVAIVVGGYFVLNWLDPQFPWWWIPLLILIALLVLVMPAILIRKNRYRISNYRIDFEQGLLSKRIDTLELWHVEDVQMQQGLLDRILRVGTINIASGDRTTPMLELKSLPEPRKIYDAIKQRVIAVKRQRGVLKVDSGGMGDGGGEGFHHH